MKPLPMRRVAVLGGTGFVGRALCEKLSAASPSLRIVVPTRRLPHAQPLLPLPAVDVLQADVHDDRQLTQVLAGVEPGATVVTLGQQSLKDGDAVQVVSGEKAVAGAESTASL